MQTKRDGEQGGYSAHTTRKSVVIEQWSRVSGRKTGERLRVRHEVALRFFGVSAINYNATDLHDIALAAFGGAIPCETLRHGRIVA